MGVGMGRTAESRLVRDGGRDERLRQLFVGNYRFLLAYALRRTPSRADAEDVVSAVFVVAWRRLDSLPEDTDEQRLWLYGVARRTLANHRRAVIRAARLSRRVQQQWSERLAADDAAQEDASDVDTALRALERLAESDRELVLLASWEQLSHAEIAQVVDTSVANVSVRLHRARRRLHCEFERLLQASPVAGHVDQRKATRNEEQESRG